ncbi:MAG TPA: arylsulfatase [Acidimicrobiia bacterium]|nr:arylsulfatase [Acidimicrobiia bacterium]
MGAGGRIGRTIKESEPSFAPAPRPPAGAPNVVVVVLDDLGFAQLGCFGSSIATPAIDQLAERGLRYNRFHVTALCSPTRACLLTGRNHHAVGMGFLTDIPTGFPGYNGRIPRSAGTLARILRDAGYNTFAVGKWHLAPRWEQSASGPFQRWPLGLGFERYYGFLAGDTNQWTPELVCDNHFVDAPRGPGDGYHLSEDLADHAIRFVQDQQQATPGKPFFLYFATGATHAPHQAPAEWIDRYRGRFDAGWEAWRAEAFARQLELEVVPAGTTLADRPSWVRAWGSLSADERRLFARQMEVFSGFLSHTDHQIGRLVAALGELGVLDDTLLVLLSDNGTSAEGGPTGSVNEHRFTHDLLDDPTEQVARIDDLGGFHAYNHYAWGWAWAGNTPLRLWKRYTWLGGVRTPLVVHWPARVIAGKEVRPQFCHAVDLMPTILDAAGVGAPDVIDGVVQQPVDGRTLVPTFDDAEAPNARSTQYFEMLGSRALYHDGWKATTDHIGSQLRVERDLVPGSHDFDEDHWALFDLEHDFSEAQDLAADHPELVQSLVELWWAEAGRNQVLPLDDSFIGRAVAMVPPPTPPRFRTVYRPGGGPISEESVPPLGGGFELRADVETADGAAGIVCALGDWNNGWAWYLVDRRMVLTFNVFGTPYRFVSTTVTPPGRHALGAEYRREQPAGGPVVLRIDDEVVAEGSLPVDLPFRWQIGGAGLLVGRDRGFPVCLDYEPPFPFTGTVRELVFEIPSLRPRVQENEIAAALRHE